MAASASSALPRLPRAFRMLGLALTLSSVVVFLAVAVDARIPTDPHDGPRMGSLWIQNQLPDAVLDVVCISTKTLQDVGSIAVGDADGFRFAAESQNYQRCTLTAPASRSGPALSGTFDLWVRFPTPGPADNQNWLVNRDGFYAVPNVNKGIRPQDGRLIYHWI